MPSTDKVFWAYEHRTETKEYWPTVLFWQHPWRESGWEVQMAVVMSSTLLSQNAYVVMLGKRIFAGFESHMLYSNTTEI